MGRRRFLGGRGMCTHHSHSMDASVRAVASVGGTHYRIVSASRVRSHSERLKSVCVCVYIYVHGW